MRSAKTLIRPGGCPGWSASSLGAQPFWWFWHVAAHICLDSSVPDYIDKLPFPREFKYNIQPPVSNNATTQSSTPHAHSRRKRQFRSEVTKIEPELLLFCDNAMVAQFDGNTDELLEYLLHFWHAVSKLHLNPRMTKPTKWHVRQAKTHIAMRSVGSKGPWPVFLHADSQGSQQTERTCQFIGFVMRRF